MNKEFPLILVIHVKSALEREKHIVGLAQKHQFNFQFITDYDIEELTPDFLQEYFSGNMLEPNAVSSCAGKHLKAYEYILQHNLDGAIVLEDDIFLATDFKKTATAALDEAKNKHYKGYLASFENSGHQQVAKNMLEKGRILYPANKGRCAGCYYIDRHAAETIIYQAKQQKCTLPIDWFHNQLSEQGLLQHYWSHPTVAEQGSHNGKFKSLIDNKKTGFGRRIGWALLRLWKKVF